MRIGPYPIDNDVNIYQIIEFSRDLTNLSLLVLRTVSSTSFKCLTAAWYLGTGDFLVKFSLSS